jgi:hypothetical protein
MPKTHKNRGTGTKTGSSTKGTEMIEFKLPREMVLMKRKPIKQQPKSIKKIYRMRLNSSPCRKKTPTKCWTISSCKYVYGNTYKFCRKKYNQSIKPKKQKVSKRIRKRKLN